MGKPSRDKGRLGQREFKLLLGDRDWSVMETGCGNNVEDIWGTDPDGKTWSIEVKNCKTINFTPFMAQARKNAAKSRKPWMLACKIPGTRAWLVLRQGDFPQIWKEKTP